MEHVALTTIGVDDVGIQKSCFQIMQYYRRDWTQCSYASDHEVLMRCVLITYNKLSHDVVTVNSTHPTRMNRNYLYVVYKCVVSKRCPVPFSMHRV